ncbi:MAG: hypothetical protein JW750_03310 [Anaerolineaceae bacterium]|nr:hypothetical protein [Anaerolineaceae bacterium]
MMRKWLVLFLIGFLLFACAPAAVVEQIDDVQSTLSSTGVPQAQGFPYQEIDFDEVMPADVRAEQCWNALGMDDAGRIYIGFTGSTAGKGEDFSVFRYDPATGEKKFLGTLATAAEAAENLEAGEPLPKGHTRMIFADGKMYIGSQNFHDLKQEIDALPSFRGAHLFAYDIAADQLVDESSALPDGVVLPHQGIIALNILPEDHLLVGLAHPHSDIVLYDYQAGQVREIVPGIPWKLGNPLSREIVVTPGGKVYTYRGTEDPAQREESHLVWVYDIHTGEMKSTDFSMTGGFWNGQTITRDGTTIYLSTVQGELYRLDVAEQQFTHLGNLIPAVDEKVGREIVYLYGITLSPDEQTIYAAPSFLSDSNAELYAYDIASGESSFVMKLPPGVYTGSDLRDDQGNLYMAHFGNSANLWSGRVRLFVINVE